MKKSKCLYNVTMNPMTYRDFLRKQRQRQRNRRNNGKGVFRSRYAPTGNTRAAMKERAGHQSKMWH